MSERIDNIKKALAESRERVNYVFDRMGDAWDTPIYSDGAAWNAHQLAIHMAISDRGLSNQAIGIAADKEIIPADFDLERFNRRSVEKSAERTIEQVREDMAASRAELLQWLDQLADESVLDKEGRMAALHIWSVERILYWIANHEKTHADDMARVAGIQ